MRIILSLVALLAVLTAMPGAAVADSAGPAVWPLDPRPSLVTGFGPPTTPLGAGRRGCDLLGPRGQPARAAPAGTVPLPGTLAGRGLVFFSHGATRTTYEPVAPTV